MESFVCTIRNNNVPIQCQANISGTGGGKHGLHNYHLLRRKVETERKLKLVKVKVKVKLK